MARYNKSRSLEWGSANRPKISNKLGVPNPTEGSDGDIQVRQTNLGAKLFSKLGGRWYDSPLGIDGKVKFGTNLSNYLSIDNDSVDIFTNNVKVATFGATTTVKDINLTGKIVLTSGTNVTIGTGNADLGADNVTIGRLTGASLTSNSIQNIAIGTGALGNGGDDCDYNVAIGHLAGNVFDGVGCCFVGSSAGLVCTGANNTLIGGGAGDSITSGIKNTMVGKNANPGVAGGLNQIAIGYNATGQGNNTAAIGDGDITNVYMAEDSGAKVWCTNIDSSSDSRIKKNINQTTLGLEFINTLNPVTYNFRKHDEWDEDLKSKQYWYINNKTTRDIDDTELRIGFIAQEVKEALGDVDCNIHTVCEAVNNKDVEALDYTRFVVPLTKAVQELSAKVDTMQTEINNLKSE